MIDEVDKERKFRYMHETHRRYLKVTLIFKCIEKRIHRTRFDRQEPKLSKPILTFSGAMEFTAIYEST
jgi:hypothetical protein